MSQTGRIFVNVQRVGTVGDRGDFAAVCGGDSFEDIEVSFLNDPELLQREPHEIVKEIVDRDREVEEVIQRALRDGTEVRVVGKTMDHDAYRRIAAQEQADTSSEAKRLTPKQFWGIAATWGSLMTSGDPGACMYGFDEKGVVQSEEHRADCIAYIEKHCREAAKINGAAGEDEAAQNRELDAMIRYLRSAPVEGWVGELDEFTSAYIQAALWSTTDWADESGGEHLDQNYGPEHLSPETLARFKADCAKFQALYGHLLTKANRRRRDDISPEALGGHDFWLTREGHGAGFWDGDWEKSVGETLTAAAKSFGELELEVGDAGRIHGWGGNPDPEPVEGALTAPARPAP